MKPTVRENIVIPWLVRIAIPLNRGAAFVSQEVVAIEDEDEDDLYHRVRLAFVTPF
jgi:hypothetical protein